MDYNEYRKHLHSKEERIDNKVINKEIPVKRINNIKNKTKPKEENMKTHAMVNCLYEGLKVIQVKFLSSSKSYNYKTFEDFEIGDFCVVKSPHDGYVVVEVVGVDCTLLEENTRYKWIVQRVDDSAFIEQNEKENIAIREISKLMLDRQRKKSADEIKELIGDKETALIAANLNVIKD